MICPDEENAPLLPKSEDGQRLLSIFGNYLWEALESPNTSPARWRTLNYELRPRSLWRDWLAPHKLVGVRFGHTAVYALIDLDILGRYCNADAVTEITFALETIGITRTLPIRSSGSGGLHLYIPLAEEVPTFDLACVIEQCLIAQGFEIEKGHLEIFPNTKTYGNGINKFIEYNGHRLPLQPQSGSYLLDDDLNPIGDHLSDFFATWDWATQGQDMEMLRTALPHGREARKQASRRRKLSREATAWKADLDDEIAQGWIGPGQTNRLIKAIAERGHVFEGLSGSDLVDYIVDVAASAPGYYEYCGHQQEIHQRAREWSRSVPKLYWPYGTREKPKPPPGGDNTVKAENARRRIAEAIQQIKDSEPFTTIRNLAYRIAELAGSSLETIYKNADLWHPDKAPVTAEPVIDLSPLESDLDPQNSDEQPVLHTRGKDMKCGSQNEVGAAEKNIHPRGVRGDFEGFSQLEPAPSGLSPPPDIPFDECYSLIQRKIQQLKWRIEDLREFLRPRFEGRASLRELNEHELVKLLYFLQIHEGICA
ncbi:MAG: hypothetical protein AAGF98_00555 [Cyanobacteria bacterium P01_H01_bin.153]